MATHDISLFFYIKGSKDFPSGHGIDEKFGFDRAIPTTFDSNQEDGLKTGYLKVETPVFNTTIRDIYLKNKGAREISNTYSLISDVDNCIFNYSRNNPSLGVTNRTERSLEYLSTMIDMIQEYDADLVAPDQDYLNVILKGKIKHLGKEWNLQPEGEDPKGAKILHYNLSKKPWYHDDVTAGEEFWKAVKGTGFYGDLMRAKEKYTADDAAKDAEKIKALIEKAVKLSKVKKPLLKIK